MTPTPSVPSMPSTPGAPSLSRSQPGTERGDPQPGFGRLYAPDPRDAAFAARRLAFAAAPRSLATGPKSKTWKWGRSPSGETLRPRTQGKTSQCVRYGTSHLLMLDPIVRADAFTLTEGLYPWAQANDEWPGGEPTYYGTSVRAGLQYHRKVLGTIVDFSWLFNMDDVNRRLLATKAEGGGPFVVGTDFFSGMGNRSGRATGWGNAWAPQGDLWGGHCWAIRGVRAKATTAGIKRHYLTVNSHEANEEGAIEDTALEYLLFGAGGEAAVVTEAEKPKPARVRKAVA